MLEGALRERIRTIIRQVCKELGVQIVSGVLSREHVHMFVEIPPHIAVSDFVRRVKGRSSHRVQMEFPDLRKRYWGRHFWARGYFSTTSGNITDDVILQYLQEHEPTGVSRSYSELIFDRTFGVIRPKREPRPGAELARVAESPASAFYEDTDDDEGPKDYQGKGGACWSSPGNLAM